MKALGLTTLFLCLLAVPALAQPGPDTLWTRTYGGSSADRASSVQQTADGGYIVAGETRSFGAGSRDFYLVKTNPLGDTLWTRTYGGSNEEVACSVQQTADGGYVVAGTTGSFGAGNGDFYLVKTDPLGDTLWTRTYGGSSHDWAYSVQQTADGSYIVAGTTESFGAGSWDFYLVKTNSSGDTLWTRTYGGSSSDYAYSVQQTADGGYIVAGYETSFGAGNGDLYLVKTNSQGDTLWTRTYGGSEDDGASSVQQTADGGYIVAGYTESFGAGSNDFYLVKTNSQGDTLWTRTYGGSNIDVAYSVQQTADGGYIVAGYTSSFGAGGGDFYLVKTNSLGDTLWTRTYGGSGGDYAESVQLTDDGGYVVAGFTYSFGAGNGDFYVVKTGPERPYYTTVYLNDSDTNAILRWMAPETCDYNIYSTISASAGEPPTGWTLEVTLFDIPAGPAEWTDPADLGELQALCGHHELPIAELCHGERVSARLRTWLGGKRI